MYCCCELNRLVSKVNLFLNVDFVIANLVLQTITGWKIAYAVLYTVSYTLLQVEYGFYFHLDVAK